MGLPNGYQTWNETAQIRTNTAGVAASDGQGYKRIPTGPITFDVIEVGIGQGSKGGLNAAFEIQIVAPAEGAGAKKLCFVRIPHDQDQSSEALNARPIWRAWQEAAGLTAAQLDAGVVVNTGALFRGKRLTGYHEQKIETIPRRDGNGTIEVDNGDTRAVSPAAYARLVQAGGGATAPTQAPAQEIPGYTLPQTQAPAQVVIPTQPQPQVVIPQVTQPAAGGGDLNSLLAGLGLQQR